MMETLDLTNQGATSSPSGGVSPETPPEADYKAISEALAKEISDIKAELESFKSENGNLKAQYAALQAENQKTKELNFMLARTVDAGQKKVTAEEAMYNLFLGGNANGH